MKEQERIETLEQLSKVGVGYTSEQDFKDDLYGIGDSFTWEELTSGEYDDAIEAFKDKYLSKGF